MKIQIKTLIHTALVSEAKPIIGHFNLMCINKIPFNIYKNSGMTLIVSGIGYEKTKSAITYALSIYQPKIAINIGMAGCTDKSIEIGSLLCTTHESISIPYASLSSYKNPICSAFGVNSILVDQEGEAFLNSIPQSIEKYMFKVVSDHLEPSIPSKAKVSSLIQKSIHQWSKYAG